MRARSPGSVSPLRASVGCRHPCISRLTPGCPLRAMERARHASPRCDLDRRHHDSSCRPLARDPGLPGTGPPACACPQGGEPEDANVLVFEARSADPVADLVFHQTQAQPACQVRGRAAGRPGAPELDELIGVGGRGPTRELSIELPPTWVPDRVRWKCGRIACLASDHSGGWQHPAAHAPSRRRGCPGRPSP